MTKPVYIIGFMGCGKTTIGKLLARKLQYQFVDLDKRIEMMEGKSISELFKQYGEDGFRLLEKKHLELTTSLQKTVISCGGGTPCFFYNMKTINEHGFSVYLEMNGTSLFSRLRNSKAERPLINGKTDAELKSFIADKLIERLPYYKQAHVTVNALNAKTDIALDQTIELLELL